MYAQLIVLKKRCMLILAAYLMLFLFGCTETIHFYPPDKSQCITVITENWTHIRDTIDGKHDRRARYIIAGKHLEVPEENFVKLDIDSGDRYRAGFYICWKSEQYEWEAVVHNAVVIESTLDTTRFNFSTSLPKDDRGIPTAIKFAKEGCAVFDFGSKRFSPDRGRAIVEYE